MASTVILSEPLSRRVRSTWSKVQTTVRHTSYIETGISIKSYLCLDAVGTQVESWERGHGVFVSGKGTVIGFQQKALKNVSSS